MRRLRIAVGLFQATTALGGLEPWEAEGRQHLTVEVTRDVHLSGSVEFVGGVGGASHEGALGIGTMSGIRLGLGRWDVAILGGTWLFEEPVPVRRSRRLAFTAQAEIGRQIGDWRIAAELYHLSNAGFGQVNPGFNGLGLKLGWGR